MVYVIGYTEDTLIPPARRQECRRIYIYIYIYILKNDKRERYEDISNTKSFHDMFENVPYPPTLLASSGWEQSEQPYTLYLTFYLPYTIYRQSERPYDQRPTTNCKLYFARVPGNRVPCESVGQRSCRPGLS